MTPPDADVTQLLLDAHAGDEEAFQALMPLVYEELRVLARQHFRRERDDHTLTPTALVHEAYFKLVDQRRVAWNDRAHFYAVASMAMRRILVSYARQRSRLKRGGDLVKLALDDGPPLAAEAPPDGLVALDEALSRLQAFDARAARVVECRYFGGLTVEETAAALDTSPRTVKRDWRLAKTWLRRELDPEG